MEKEEFTASEVVAGFPLVSIKRALSHVGLMDDRDDIKIVAEALRCPRGQAEGVLDTLERRGFVTKAGKKNKWDMTPLGNRLRFHWKPPRRIEPVIERDEDSAAINEGFESVWCSILRADSNDSITFEEGQFEVGVFVDYESDRVIELSVVQPDFYDDPESSSTIETSVYLDVAEAKKLAHGLQAAIERAEAEIARRAAAKPRKQRKAKGRAEPNMPGEIGDTLSTVERGLKGESTLASDARASSKAKAAGEKKEEARKKRERNALASTLAELSRGR
jgi:hypothetical protein